MSILLNQPLSIQIAGTSLILNLSVTEETIAPDSLSGLVQWHDANDASTLTLDGSNRVTEWRDKSTSALHLEPAAVGPLFVSNVANGKPAVRFNSAATERLQKAVAVLSGRPAHIFVVGSTSGSVGHTLWSQGQSTSSSIYSTLGNSAGVPQMVMRGGGSPVVASATATTTDGEVGLYSAKIEAATYHSVKFNGADESPNASSSIAVAGNYTVLGAVARSAFDNKLMGDIHEVLVYSRILSASEEDSIKSHLAAKWGISL